MRKKVLFIATAAFTWALPSLALEKTDEEALKNTQQLLTDDQALQAFAKDNKDAVGALDQVDKMTGGNGQQKNEINHIASDAFADMVKANNGDSAAVMLKLQQGLKDPQAFLNSLSPDQQARIKALAGQIDKQNAGNRAPASVAPPTPAPAPTK